VYSLNSYFDFFPREACNNCSFDKNSSLPARHFIQISRIFISKGSN